MSDFVELKSLVRKCRKGNRDSQKKFYMHYHSFGLRICLRYAKNRDHAIYILNESFYEFFTNKREPDEEVSIEVQLGKIILDSIISDYHHIKNKEYNGRQESGIPENNIEISPFPENDILAILQTLPDLERIIFNLHVVDSYSHEEIAKQFAISAKESELRLDKARIALKSFF